MKVDMHTEIIMFILVENFSMKFYLDLGIASIKTMETSKEMKKICLHHPIVHCCRSLAYSLLVAITEAWELKDIYLSLKKI